MHTQYVACIVRLPIAVTLTKNTTLYLDFLCDDGNDENRFFFVESGLQRQQIKRPPTSIHCFPDGCFFVCARSFPPSPDMHYVVSLLVFIDGENILNLIADYYYYCFAERKRGRCFFNILSFRFSFRVQARAIDRWQPDEYVYLCFFCLIFGCNQNDWNWIKRSRPAMKILTAFLLLFFLSMVFFSQVKENRRDPRERERNALGPRTVCAVKVISLRLPIHEFKYYLLKLTRCDFSSRFGQFYCVRSRRSPQWRFSDALNRIVADIFLHFIHDFPLLAIIFFCNLFSHTIRFSNENGKMKKESEVTMNRSTESLGVLSPNDWLQSVVGAAILPPIEHKHLMLHLYLSLAYFSGPSQMANAAPTGNRNIWTFYSEIRQMSEHKKVIHHAVNSPKLCVYEVKNKCERRQQSIELRNETNSIVRNFEHFEQKKLSEFRWRKKNEFNIFVAFCWQNGGRGDGQCEKMSGNIIMKKNNRSIRSDARKANLYTKSTKSIIRCSWNNRIRATGGCTCAIFSLVRNKLQNIFEWQSTRIEKQSAKWMRSTRTKKEWKKVQLSEK